MHSATTPLEAMNAPVKMATSIQTALKIAYVSVDQVVHGVPKPMYIDFVIQCSYICTHAKQHGFIEQELHTYMQLYK